MKKGDKVTARTVNGHSRDGVYVKTHQGTHGVWVEVKPHDTTKGNYKTRPACVTPA